MAVTVTPISFNGEKRIVVLRLISNLTFGVDIYNTSGNRKDSYFYFISIGTR